MLSLICRVYGTKYRKLQPLLSLQQPSHDASQKKSSVNMRIEARFHLPYLTTMLTNKKGLFFAMAIVVLTLTPFVGVHATVFEASFLSLIGNIIIFFAGLLGKILTLIIGVFIALVQYNNFIKEPIVTTGFYIVRQLCTMLFVVILLVIAIATVLHIESYHWRRTLPKMMIMVVLVYFSLSITGFMIDIAQAVMLTFANTIRDAGAGDFANNLGLQNFLNISVEHAKATKKDSGDEGSSNFWSVILSLGVALIALFLAVIVMAMLVAVIVVRIVMLWMYAIFSPFAWFLQVFPGGQKYASQWWTGFTKYLINGPILTFFIWLALSSFSATLNGVDLSGSTKELCISDNSIGCLSNMSSFLVFLGLMVGSLILTRELAGAASGATNAIHGGMMKGVSKIKQFAGRHKMVVGGALVGAATGGVGLVALGAVLGKGAKIGARAGTLRVGGKIGAYAKAGKEKFADSYAGKFLGYNERYNKELQINQQAKAKMRLEKDPEKKKRLAAQAAREIAEQRRLSMVEKGGRPTEEYAEAEARNALAKANKKKGLEHIGLTDLITEDTQALAGGFEDTDIIDAMKNVRLMSRERRAQILKDSPGDSPRDRMDAAAAAIFSGGGTTTTPAPRMIVDEELGKMRGTGEVSVNRFARGEGKTVAVDFDEAFSDLDFVPKKGTDYSRTKGINVTDADQIGKVASRLASTLDTKIRAIEAKGGKASQTETQKMERMRRARDRMNSIASGDEKVQQLELINSAAVGYGLRDAIKTTLHEQAHTAGATDTDNQAEHIAQMIERHKMYANRDAVTRDVSAGVAEDEIIRRYAKKQDTTAPVPQPPEVEINPDELVNAVRGKSAEGQHASAVQMENNFRTEVQQRVAPALQRVQSGTSVQIAGGKYFSINQLTTLKKVLQPLMDALNKLGGQNANLQNMQDNLAALARDLDEIGEDGFAQVTYMQNQGEGSPFAQAIELTGGGQDKEV